MIDDRPITYLISDQYELKTSETQFKEYVFSIRFLIKNY